MALFRSYLLFCSLAAAARGLEILDPEEVEYLNFQAQGRVGGSVTLECGSNTPTIFIWAYVGSGTGKDLAVAYSYGQGPKLQPQSRRLGRISIPSNASSLVIQGLAPEAEGTYTCQALYDTEDGARITFYSTRLDVEGD